MSYYFKQIELTNWKNFRNANVPLFQRTFVVGPNAVGKSNFLDAFRFLRDLAVEGGGLTKAVEWRGWMKGVRSLHARQHPEVTISVEIGSKGADGYRYQITFGGHPKRIRKHEPVVIHEKVDRISPTGVESKIIDRKRREKDDVEEFTQTLIQQVSANKDFRELAEFFKSVSYLHLVPQLLREEQSPIHFGSSPDSFGRDLLEQMRGVGKRKRDGRLSKIGGVLKTVVPQLEDLSFEIDEKGRPRLKVKFHHWRANAASQYETQLSDGTLRLIGLLWSVQERGGILLLEEPELSLHGEIVGKLAYFIHTVQKVYGRQVLVSTHSERLLQDEGIAPEELILIRPCSEGSEIINGASIDDVVDLMQNGLTAADAMMPRTITETMSQFGGGEL